MFVAHSWDLRREPTTIFVRCLFIFSTCWANVKDESLETKKSCSSSTRNV